LSPWTGAGVPADMLRGAPQAKEGERGEGQKRGQRSASERAAGQAERQATARDSTRSLYLVGSREKRKKRKEVRNRVLRGVYIGLQDPLAPGQSRGLLSRVPFRNA
jgi:hypothetical protein